MWPNRRGPPLLVAHEQQRDLGVALRARGQRAQDAEREHVAALHVDRAGADAASRRRARAAGARRGRRPCRGGRAAGSAPSPVPRSARDQVVGVVGRGARDALELGASSGSSAAHTDGALLGAVARRRTARRRRRAPPARAARGARSRPRACDPVVHRRARYPATVYGRCPSCPRWRSPPAGSSESLPGETIESAADAGDQRAEDVRPAAERARRRDDRRACAGAGSC